MPDDEKDKKAPASPSAPEGTGEKAATEAKPDEAKAAPADDAKPAGAEAERGEGVDAYRPEEIAKRIEKLGEETDLDRIAREEEQKLAARRREQKKGDKGKKKGLEAAASKRLSKIAADKPIKRPVAFAQDADPLLASTAKLQKWAKTNQRAVSFVVLGALLAVFGTGIYLYMQKKKDQDASALLSQAVADERGRVGEDKEPAAGQLKDLRPIFKTEDERRDAALAKYREVESKYPGTGAAILGRLGEAAILLDKKDAAGALTAYEDVKGSPLGQVDAEVKGRALEGAGFANEMLAEQKPDEKDKRLDAALTAYKALAGIDGLGWKPLGEYHQARVLQAKGDRDEATKLLKGVYDAVGKKGTPFAPKTGPDDTDAYFYLRDAAEDRLRMLDRNMVPSKQMEQMMQQMQRMQQSGQLPPPKK